MKIAAAYVRVSTEEQVEYSPESQIKQIRDYAKRNNMVVPNEYIFMDEGISGKNTKKRPEFNRMIGTAKIKPKPFDAILLWKFSRFARNREDSIVYKSMLRKQLDIEVISVSEQLGDDKLSILIEAMIEAMDEYYSINLAEEVKRGMNEKVSRGEPVTAPAFGYDIKNKQYVIHPDMAPVVRMIFNDYLSGMGCRDIASKLNGMGIRTKRGGRWENRTVEYILCNPVYLGKIRWNPSGKTHRNYDDPNIIIRNSTHEPIIDTGTWEQTQAQLARQKIMYSKYVRHENPSEYMLHGLVRCSNCGATLSRATASSLQCHSYARGKCDVSHSITLTKLNAAVIAAIDATLKSGKFVLIQKTAHKQSDEAEIIERQIMKERQKLIRVREAYEAEIDTIDEYKVRKARIQEKIAELETTLPKQQSGEEIAKKFRENHKDTTKQLRDETLSEDEKNKLLRTFIERIIFDRVNGRIEIFYYV